MTYALILLTLVGLLVLAFAQGTLGPQDLQAAVGTDGIKTRFAERVRTFREHIRSWIRQTARDELHEAVDKALAE